MARLDKVYLGTNLKMYKNIAQTVSYLKELCELTKDIDRSKLELFVIPSYTSLDAASKHVDFNLIKLGAQNMAWEDEGQFTGEISPLMLKELGIKIVEIGHSERRHIMGETDEMENKKVHCALRHGLIPLLCIGETDEQKSFGLSDEVLRTQLKRGLHGVSREQAERIWIAYEPVWAIGVNGKPASGEYAAEKHRKIRDTLVELFGHETGSDIPLLYGGSVNLGNSMELMQIHNINGLFIGRSAWDAHQFQKIINNVMSIT